MEIRKNYLINEKTGLLMGEYYTNGTLYTRVIEDMENFLVAMSPVHLIDKSLLQYGSSLIGALSSSKEVLGEMYMYPIKVSSSLDIWLFPSKSYKKSNCIWFVLNHIEDTLPQSVQQTEVFLRFGHQITIKMKESAFRTKRRNAEKLRERISNNINNSSFVKKKEINGYLIKEEKDQYKFSINED
ncbi:competence protein ComK [Neobacillus drentensis]|uniref:competence protein ComK n=1 Tax=Neobacillus drentensis TaxID=220684 RepID=UPI001F2172C1|nr:competence protein ComK [Neobacillus drentensis]ULT59590.1 competence protein ComK [Neobacillus drentensis]